VVGVSLISLREGIGAAAIIKALTLKMLRATTQQGIAQWDNASLRVHTRMGALRLLGPVPSAHGKAETSFLYAVDLTDEGRWHEAMIRSRKAPTDAPEGAAWLPVADRDALRELLSRAASGERIEILPPGLSGDRKSVLVRRG
jgi:hypothetical protein